MAEPQIEFLIQKVYTKDVSLEVPGAPEVFQGEWKPDANVDINTETRELETDTYEVELTLTLTTKTGEKTAFIAEVKQCGIFVIKGVPAEQIGPMLGSYCPNVLFPYAREAVSSLVIRGGFPEINIAPVNFDALYAQSLQQQQGQESATQH